MNELELDLKFLKMKWAPQTADQNAAWELYVELLTRITTQALPKEHGDEKTALDSVYSLFPTTREIIKKQGKECINFAKIAIPVLNQIVRPFTAEWHRASLAGAFERADRCQEFRNDLSIVQENLPSMLAYSLVWRAWRTSLALKHNTTDVIDLAHGISTGK
jgi:hypothetical protein